MKTQELRIGNCINTIEGVAIIQGIHKEGWIATNILTAGDLINFAEPIPLTEEWLLKFGFILGSETDEFTTTNNNDIIYNNNNDGWSEDLYYISFGELSSFCMSGNGCLKYVEYVHQLQNLYFALTGEELELK